ncbi:hypothetical protein RB595_002988 [Gaeumannomyces hyphopodioides]
MGVVDSQKNVPPLPAPTETETTAPSEVSEYDFSPPPENRSHYSLPEDGTPVTIRTRHKANRSQTSLLIEYFEGPKGSTASGSGGERRPSVRVRLTPSKSRKDGHIQVTETKSSRRTSQTHYPNDTTLPSRLNEGDAVSVLSGEGEDAYSMDSYASATEESNVSRQPIEVEIDHRRRRRPASPLIPTSDNSKVSYQPNTASEISAIPTDSFLDGSGPSSGSPVRTRDKSPSRAGHVLAGAAAGLAAAAVVDKARSGGRSESKERPVLPKTRDKERSDRKGKNKSRNGSVSEKRDRDEDKSTRRKSSRSQHDTSHSVADSSVVSSTMAPSHRSQDQQSVRSGASKSSINNPKLLDAVEDAIRRLILPELEELKREKSQRSAHGRRNSTASTSGTSVSRDDVTSTADRRRSGGSERHGLGPRDSIGSKKAKETRNREARNAVVESPAPSESQESAHELMHQELDATPARRDYSIRAAAAGAVAGALGIGALNNASAAPAREQRKRRRAEAKSRAANGLGEDYDDSEFQQTAPMPLSSEVNPSELTRQSILSADTDLERPHSATEELTPVREVPGGRGMVADRADEESNTTPTQKPAATLAGLGTQHMNVSHGDLRALPRTGSAVGATEFETDEYGRKYPINRQQEYDDYDEAEDDYPYDDQQGFDYYDTQHVPAPLKYEPYGVERRGLSPIPSVSGYTEGGSEVQARDSRVTHTTSGSLSSPGKSPHHDHVPFSADSELSNTRSRDFEHDDRSVRSSAVGYRNPTLTEDSELGADVSSGQAVRGIVANPNFVHIPSALGVESAVASLIDGSMLDGSVLTNGSGRGGLNQQYNGDRGSMATLPEEGSYGRNTPDAHSINRDVARGGTPRSMNSRTSGVSHDRGQPRSAGFAGEYELDQFGRKVPAASQSAERQSPTASEAAITGAAFAVASARLRDAAKEKGMHTQTEDAEEEDYTLDGPGVQRNKSFKERTMDGHRPANTPMHSVDRLDEFEKPRMGASGVPDFDDPEPEIGFYEPSNPSIIEGQLDGEDQEDRWAGQRTPTQERHVPPQDESFRAEAERSGHGLEKATAAKVAAGAALATAAALASSHSRQPSQDHEDWQRTSDDRKRDTLVTNPFEGTSPQVNLPGLGNDLLGSAPPVFQNPGYGAGFATRSPLGHNNKVDEGYISQGANENQEMSRRKGKGVELSQPMNADLDDPFYTSKAAKHMSGLSQGMGSPLYDPSTGAGIDRIESKDIIALMQHLMVRDAQRSARDTEILMTLVRSAAEMRESFEKIKHMIADSEDVIIREVDENTEKTVQRVIGGPRPFPGSAPRSVQGGSQAGTDDMPTKKQNMFRRALKGLSAKGNNDLGRIEDMLMQLLTEVDTLKAQTAGHSMGASPTRDGVRSPFSNLQPAVQYEHDRGYEPEGHAGTSTASHASQSGHLSIPSQSRGASASKTGYERKFSDHRISTVHEANEDEYDHQLADRGAALGYHRDDQYDTLGMHHTPERNDIPRSGSVPVATPPHPALPAQAASNENTPHTDKSKKHKSSSSSNWFPKISRWSETTASSVGKVFRKNNASRSGSDLAFDGQPNTDPYGDDKLHTGFTQEDLRDMMPEDPKYKAHRDSLNLRHPQPRPGQQYQVAIETGAEQFNTPHSPYSADWAHSATSLNRLQGRDNARPQDPQFWGSSPAPLAGAGDAGDSSPLGPPRPPKEPLDEAQMGHRTPPKSSRVSKLQKTAASPLPYHSVESGYGTGAHGSYHGSPKLENRNLSSALGNSAPTRRPSGPRAMTPKSEDERRRKRDTFGSLASQESETF